MSVWGLVFGLGFLGLLAFGGAATGQTLAVETVVVEDASDAPPCCALPVGPVESPRPGRMLTIQEAAALGPRLWGLMREADHDRAPGCGPRLLLQWVVVPPTVVWFVRRQLT